jgi:hypothetical protein
MLLDAIELDEETLRAAYEDRSEEFNQPERRLVERLIYTDQANAQAAMDRITAEEITFDALVEERGLTLADVEKESTVYLIPEMESPEGLDAFVRERYLEILETELRAWEEDQRQWPEAVDWSLFQRFLQVEHKTSMSRSQNTKMPTLHC